MIIQFKNAYLEKLFENKPVSGKPKYNTEVVLKFKKTVLWLKSANSIREIRSFKGLNFEALKGKLKGFLSVRVDRSYRLILTIDEEAGIVIKEVITVHDLNNHYQ
ncbi:MAG: type II toxin-antitoxin system RelE/ParE family toxin [Chitinophagaceae bacterium]|jgi:toxin HigB-1|nr:type II toxin-antitoxin system RelE/ParE family toxin [Chitinophagaceae bacterium]